MLSRKYLLSREEIRFLTSKRISPIQGRYFGLIFSPSEETCKFGVIISKKISLKAVERNRIKRLLFRVIGSQLLGMKGLFLFLAKKDSINGKLEVFLKELEEFKNKLER